jgi:energy-coupling factor transporter ATP-binding protein EcfA2
MPKYSLDNVTINGFRGLRNLHLEGLGLINILVGRNDSGKTSVLEALSILCNPVESPEWLSMIRRRDFGELDETMVQSLRWCFPQNGQRVDPDSLFAGECTMTCDGTFPLRRLRVVYKDLVGEPESETADIEPSRGVEITHFIDWADGEPQTIRLEVWEGRHAITAMVTPRGQIVLTETVTPYSYQINRVQVRSLSRFLIDHDSGLILDLIREFDPDVQDIKIASLRGGRPAIYLNHRRLGPAPLSILGDGLRRAVLLASTLLTLKDGGVLLIDEMEAGIRVRALRRVFAWLTKVARDLGVQIVATTHSLEAVDGIIMSNKELIDDVVTFRLDQAEHETRAKRIYGDLLLRLRYESGLDVR